MPIAMLGRVRRRRVVTKRRITVPAMRVATSALVARLDVVTPQMLRVAKTATVRLDFVISPFGGAKEIPVDPVSTTLNVISDLATSTVRAVSETPRELAALTQTVTSEFAIKMSVTTKSDFSVVAIRIARLVFVNRPATMCT